MIFSFFKKPLGWAVGALIVVLAAWWGYSALTRDAKTEARLGRNQAEAALEAGRDAVETTSGQAKAERADDKLSEENEDAIQSAPGADAPVDPALRGAALRSLCKRRVYLNHPKCVQFTSPVGVDGGR